MFRITHLCRTMRHCPCLFKAKHDNVMIDSRIMLKFVIVYYILLYISFYFFHQSADVV
jgi:hypothetical protein